MRVIYSVLLYILYPIPLLLTLQQAAARAGGIRYVLQRLGLARFQGEKAAQQRLWFHAASVGEVTSLFPLLIALSRENELSLTVSVNTPEAIRALEKFCEQYELARIQSCYLPLDFYFSTRRFIKQLKASKLIVVETEIWPNLFAEASRSGLELLLINARLSDKTMSAPRALKGLYQHALNCVDRVGCRDEHNSARYVDLGAQPDTVSILGNLKRCAVVVSKDLPSAVIAPTAKLPNRDYVLVISSRPDEERLIWTAWRGREDKPLLVIAPRHLSRIDEVVASLSQAGASVSLLSSFDAGSAPDVLLIDSMGLIQHFLPGALLAIIGGSFAPFGGHNVLEPALQGKTVVVGPHTENVDEDVVWLQELGVLIQLEAEALGNLDLDSMKGDDSSDAAWKVKSESEKILATYIDFISGAERG